MLTNSDPEAQAVSARLHKLMGYRFRLLKAFYERQVEPGRRQRLNSFSYPQQRTPNLLPDPNLALNFLKNDFLLLFHASLLNCVLSEEIGILSIMFYSLLALCWPMNWDGLQ